NKLCFEPAIFPVVSVFIHCIITAHLGVAVPPISTERSRRPDNRMPRHLFRDVDGFYVFSVFSEEWIRSALGYKPVPEDVFIVSYQKCGTTWMQHIVYNIFNGRSPPTNPMDASREMPFLELQGPEIVKEMPRPGAIKTHMPFGSQPYSVHAKYIYICRNPYDCCVSFFYHTKGFAAFQFQDGTFDEFFELFLNGKPDFSDYFEHLLSWYEHRHDPNVLFLTYEDLKKDTRAWVLKIADFLGEEYGTRLRAEQGLLEGILSRTSFENMKVLNATIKEDLVKVVNLPVDKMPNWLKCAGHDNGAEKVEKPLTDDVFRKGNVGDWRNHFSADQVKRLKERIELRTRGSDVMDLWKDNGLP
ncbi:unnamed protein product, partial [Ixodes pacificus]